MAGTRELPLPVLDALPLGAHRVMALTDEDLFRSCGVRVAFYGREGGVSDGCFASLNCSLDVGDDVQAVERNRRIACEAAGAAQDRMLELNQVHGTDIVVVQGPQGNDGSPTAHAPAAADGLLIGLPHVAALLLSADCPLVAVVSPSGRFALVHAGWRGAVAGIAGKAVRLLAREDAFDPVHYNAYIGPHICGGCFEVGEDVSRRFASEFGEACVPDARHVSLAAAISADLIRNGMQTCRIADARSCTVCNPNKYFSYRATGGTCGRNCAIAVRTGEDNDEVKEG